MWSRLFAVLSLMILSPLVAEYLLGSLPVSMLPILPVMILMYGTGAVLVREIVRRTGKGWPSLILLATAYGFIEEGLIDQSLFNPNYMHLRLLDFGFIPALGTSPVWAIYVLGLHMFWSISAPVGLTECLFPAKRTMPWLGPIGTGVVAVLFLAGLGLVATFTYKQFPFMATPAEIICTLIIIVVLATAALLWPKPRTAAAGRAPHPVVLFLVGFVPGSLFVASEFYGARLLHATWPEATALLAGCELLALLLMIALTRGRAWTNTQRFALTAGALAVYIWFGFPTDLALHHAADLPGHTVLVAVFLAVTVLAGIRAVRFKEEIH
jgi:hypothetical protein